MNVTLRALLPLRVMCSASVSVRMATELLTQEPVRDVRLACSLRKALVFVSRIVISIITISLFI